ncbi:MAG: fluoride efflux transporter CrcB [Chloroflexi bacterium]|nr:fluoride efflux transporter CrcB [Chloroflexota bacterium]
MSSMLFNFLIIGVGGFFGAIFRYLICVLLGDFRFHGAPIGILTANVVGSFLIGITLAFSIQNGIFSKHTFSHFFFVIGFLGALTTFSSFSQDNLNLLLDKNLLGFLLNVILNVFLCLAMTTLGYLLISKT